jgi:predicted XRE-type DNA-binding protein
MQRRLPDTEIVDGDAVVHRGSGNFLADHGIEDTEEFRVKAHLCHATASIIEDRRLTQDRAAEMTGLKQADVSRIVNSRFDDYSVWRLMKVLAALGSDILIAINPANEHEPGVIMPQNVEASDEEGARGMAP